MKIDVKYNKKADTLYISFSHEKVAYTRQLDRERSVDYSREGEITGFRFVSASSGVNTEGLPHRTAIERALSGNGFVQHAQKQAAKQAQAPQKSPLKARIISFLWTTFAISIFIGSLVASVLLARSMFVLESLPGLVAALFGLTVTLFPTVLGGLVLWLIAGCAVQKNPQGSSEATTKARGKRVKAEKQPLD